MAGHPPQSFADALKIAGVLLAVVLFCATMHVAEIIKRQIILEYKASMKMLIGSFALCSM